MPAIPTLKEPLQTAASQATDASVQTIVVTAAKLAGPTFKVAGEIRYQSASASGAGGVTYGVAAPIVGPPFRALASTPAELSPSSTQQVPAGGRNYAAP